MLTKLQNDCVKWSVSLQDIEHLEALWEMTQEWDGTWDDWKVDLFSTLNTENMSRQASGLMKRLDKQTKEVKV